jgi:hypothetical protein
MAQAVADAVGATKRQVQLWSDAGAIQCFPETDRQGRGRQRLYPRSELPFAAMAAFLARYQIPIGMIRAWVGFARMVLAGQIEPLPSTRRGTDWYRSAFRGEEESYMMFRAADGVITGSFGWNDRKLMIEGVRHNPGYIVLNVRKVIAPFVE